MLVEIELMAEDWMMTAGLIGLSRLYKDNPPEITKKGIVLTEQHLYSFSQRYFDWILHTFDRAKYDENKIKQIQKKMEKFSGLEQIKVENQASASKTIQDVANKIYNVAHKKYKDKIMKNFPETIECQKLKKLLEDLKQITKDKQAYLHGDRVEKFIAQYCEIISVDFINHKITLDYAKAVVLKMFFGQASFLQTSFNKENTQQHINRLEKDITLPALMELELYHELCKSPEDAEIMDVLEKYKEVYAPFKKWFNKIKKRKNKEDIHRYFLNEELPCFLIEGLPASQSYSDSTFTPLGYSESKAFNFSWNFNKNMPTPISALSRLVLFSIPVGLALYNRRFGNENTYEDKVFLGMIMSPKNFQDNLNMNERYDELRRKRNTLGEMIADLLSESEEKAKKHSNEYIFLELHSEYSLKKTLLDYYHMPAYLVRFFATYADDMRRIHEPYVRDEFVRMLLKGIDPKKTIYMLLRLAINPKGPEQFRALESRRFAYSAYIASKARRRVSNAKLMGTNEIYKEVVVQNHKKSGGLTMQQDDKKILIVYSQAIKLRNALSNPIEKTSRNKKLESIAYRLLNSAKAGNKKEFMDTIFRVYLSANARQTNESESLKVPFVLLEGIQDQGLDFDTIATSFIAGLLGQDMDDWKKKKEEDSMSIGGTN